ncbi:metallophosphoesterase [Halocalculus aciditolerans]|uniref:Phosphoesterase n=1 Tax=Halocalculus aciditolerans TaxID=1383812 RepID=A0A830F4H4_9EURY|nr:metallophosphoesterase [Halocalculus aciditolerans]GGL54256.1 phosphoesterase [Halocalculus aciditolerans]
MARVDPVPDAPAAVAHADGERALVVADYHAGIERSLRRDGLEVRSHAAERRERLLDLLDRTAPDRMVFLGDLGHHIGEPDGEEREELEALVDAIDVPVTLVKGNHDGKLDAVVDSVTAGDGIRVGDVGFTHGHTWPARRVLDADVVCMGHEHPTVRLADDVGGSRVERVWLRGPLDPAPFEAHYDDFNLSGDPSAEPGHTFGELVVFPAFNDLSSGTWVNVDGQEFLAPFLPAALPEADAYLLDGTRLGPYRSL